MTLREWLDTPGNTSVALARQLGLKAHSTVLRWAQNRVPADRVAAVSAATGIPRQKLRPDLYEMPGEAA